MDPNKPGILDIPIEMLEEIFTKLNARDILSCSKVCKQFWNATKKNKIWQQICRSLCDNSKYVIDYVTTVPSTVEPVNLPPQEVLASVCEWRRVYMRLLQLKRNFINGVYKIQFVSDYLVQHNIDTRVFHDLLVVKNYENNKVQVWNVRTEPRLVGTIVGALTGVQSDLFMIGDNIVIVLQGTVLQGFKINIESGDITSMYRRLVNGNNHSYIPDPENINSWYKKKQRSPQNLSTCVSGKYFICLVRLGDRFLLYQWNMETGQNVHESDFPCPHFFSLISPKTYSGDILMVTFKNTDTILNMVTIYQYNLESYLFQYVLKFYTTYKPSIYYENNKIVYLKPGRFSNKLTLRNFPPRSADMPSEISLFYIEGIIVKSFNMLGNIVSYIVGKTLIIKNNNLNDIYHVYLMKNNDSVLPVSRICSWNIVWVLYITIPQGDSVIELHDIVAKFCIKTFDINGILTNKWPRVIMPFYHCTDERRNVTLLKFW